MNRSIFVLKIIVGSLFTGFLGMMMGDLIGNSGACIIAGFLLPIIGMLACWYYDWSKK